MLHVVLVEPEIPPNTGNISRTCAATGTALHLVEPLGFRVDEASVRRAGLDYWPHLQLHRHESLQAFLQEHRSAPMYFASTRGSVPYTQAAYPDGAFLVFGKETAGLPQALLDEHPGRVIRLPMKRDIRSLNLSNAVAVVLFEALRQLGFPGLA